MRRNSFGVSAGISESVRSTTSPFMWSPPTRFEHAKTQAQANTQTDHHGSASPARRVGQKRQRPNASPNLREAHAGAKGILPPRSRRRRGRRPAQEIANSPA